MKAKTIEGMKNEMWEKAFEDVVNDRERVIALAMHLSDYNFDLEDVDGYIDNGYLVYTDEEADEAVREYIEETVWAFTPSFLSAHTGYIDEDVFKLLQEKCEGANDSIMSMIKDFDAFVEDAVACDGRGHFLSGSDGIEHEVVYLSVERDGMCYKTKETYYYIYRVN